LSIRCCHILIAGDHGLRLLLLKRHLGVLSFLALALALALWRRHTIAVVLEVLRLTNLELARRM
jgi:hypothetical protein